MDKIKFLMTDTGAQTTQLCRQALEAKGIDVTVCEKNGSQALKSLLEEHPQAVLLDAFMPDLGRHHRSNSAMNPGYPRRPHNVLCDRCIPE